MSHQSQQQKWVVGFCGNLPALQLIHGVLLVKNPHGKVLKVEAVPNAL